MSYYNEFNRTTIIAQEYGTPVGKIVFGNIISSSSVLLFLTIKFFFPDLDDPNLLLGCPVYVRQNLFN